MAETAAEVCLVRCPKCDSLLPEVTDYSVYLCGGCGTVLCASRKPIDSPTVSKEGALNNNKSEELQHINFWNQKTKDLSSELDQDGLKSNESKHIDEKVEKESGNSGPLPSSIQKPLDVENDRIEILLKLDEIKDQIVRSKQKSSFFNDPIRPRAPIQAPYHSYFSGQYVSKDSDNRMQFHHHSCSCLTCYTNHHHHHARPPPPLHYPHDCNKPRFSTLQKPHTQWSGNLHCPRRGILATTGRRCRLVAGGSPFLTCCNCFELLQMPTRKIKSTTKLRCAACSEVILLSVVNKKLVINPEKGGGNNKKKNTRRNLWRANTMDFSSKDFDASCDFDYKWLDTSLSSPPSGSPLQDHFDCSTNYNHSVSRQNSMKDVATEIKILSNEYCENTGTSQESRDQQDDTRGHESFLLGMIKKSFKLSRSNSNHQVTVNGHLLSERVVKKAEKISGPIQGGDYWYDSRAGFWGMMGGPCRGIIPPYIEELNYPMPENCADGHTGVFVNGRQLHEKDLDLLASRGLPMDRDRSYLIEISGRVIEEASGSELQCLGKLAPTVENKRHGFGMKPPKIMTLDL